jgi:hypothetical protein
MNESDEPVRAEAQVVWNDDPLAPTYGQKHVPVQRERWSPLVLGSIVFSVLCVVVFGCHWMLAGMETTTPEKKEMVVRQEAYDEAPRALYDDDDDEEMDLRHRRQFAQEP